MREKLPVFVYSDLNEPLKDLIRENTAQVDFNDKSDRERSFERCRLCPVVFGNPPREWIAGHGKLLFWQLDSAGFDQYRGIETNAVVANMGDFFSINCAETIVSGILAFYRSVHTLVRLQEEKRWVGKPLRYEMETLTGKRVILLGAGTIAQAIARLLSGFNCDVRFVARTNPDAEIRSRSSLIQALPETDILINTLPGSAGTAVDEPVFEAMRGGSIYASIGRGVTTDESALIRALDSGRLAGAVLDVTSEEPLPVSNPLWGMKQVILTQHTGGGHRLEDEGKVNQFLKNLKLFLGNHRIENAVDLTRGY